MSSAPTGHDPSIDLVVELVETLEAAGLDRDEYRLYDYVDVEALEQLLTGSNSDVEVRVTIAGVRIAVTSTGVDVLQDGSASTLE
ncbi:hypothetical protein CHINAEXTREME_21045 (plasmid) [Halobiforma lacisalsi AJ5]|uniref:Halobacterial output domain-containing protein n=1 Tax=Natronobacterium lacisalsi AJ5 TaxID=358396 RepID=M0L750_NATLA|nr:HalOD1 output domain-containing protein [Halobiforma lacisalsi]APX00290.1 hypothetical protein CHINAEXTREME_21045 [Halobiforma lacisalsi AJ5]EMA29376.1 hypothetical protein C445_17019 [Halobiforma lacisalsi AJ5]